MDYDIVSILTEGHYLMKRKLINNSLNMTNCYK